MQMFSTSPNSYSFISYKFSASEMTSKAVQAILSRESFYEYPFIRPSSQSQFVILFHIFSFLKYDLFHIE